MGKVKGRSKKGVVVPTYDSDDERAYQREPVPNVNDDDYFHDEVDQFHMQKEKLLLDKGASFEPVGSSDEDEEVLGFDDDDDDDDDQIQKYEEQLRRFKTRGLKDDLASDLEDDDNDGLPDDKAWGKNRKKFYDADVDDDHRIDFSGSEPDAALLEEQEALAIQKRMAEQLDDQDIGLEFFKPKEKTTAKENEVKVKKDLSKLSRKEQLQLLKKESPELLELIEDYKTRLMELKDRLMPIQDLIKKKVLPPSKAADYVSTKVHLYLNYCVNISFYLTLKAKHTPVQNHPVITRLVQYRNLIKTLETVDDKAGPVIDSLLEKIKKGEEIIPATSVPHVDREAALKRRMMHKMLKSRGARQTDEKRKVSELLDSEEDQEDGADPVGGRSWSRKKKRIDDDKYETKDEKAALEYYEMMKGGRQTTLDSQDKPPLGLDGPEGSGGEEASGDEDPELEDEEGDGRRAINYTIEKNKGLTPHRKKEYKNPRVKHRLKYRKAKIRRKGMVREVRTEINRYGGEMSGIRAGIKRGIKLR